MAAAHGSQVLASLCRYAKAIVSVSELHLKCAKLVFQGVVFFRSLFIPFDSLGENSICF